MKPTLQNLIFATLTLLSFQVAIAQVTLEKEVKITDLAMYFNGNKVALNTTTNSTTGYDYVYGPALTPHGDCIKVYGDYVFMTWYRGGKDDRHVMLTRYNTKTGTQKTIEFPHQHTGYNGKWWIGETHNTIAVGISPKNGTIHMLYDMHRNGNVAAFANDYLRYSYTVADAATVPDDEFVLDLFIQSPNNNYKHLAFPGINDLNTTRLLTYPAFFINDEGDLFMKMRFGYSNNGKFLFAKYDGTDWEGYTEFNRMQASSYGSEYNWGLYGDFKYLNGKLRIGFQRRSDNRVDKYQYQNGFYYAYSDDPSGLTQWKNHEGTGFTRPLADADKILVSEPGDLVVTTLKDKVNIVGGFDFTVTDNEDVHFIGKVKDNENNITKYVHTYKPSGATEFITTTDFAGAEALYSSGENIYIIGLNSSGRPYVEQAPGGTNLFSRVYEATSGKRFRKGIVNIHEGKLYYYLLENNASDSDDTQPTYLQIIDLNIKNGPKPFEVSLLSPSDNQQFEEGENVQLYAKATTDTGALTKVEFIVNGELLETDTTDPYLLDWVPSDVGTYIIKAIAYNDSDKNVESSEITIEVIEEDKTNLTGDVYRLKNVGSGKYLTSNEAAVTGSDSGEGVEKEWTFVKTEYQSKVYYNIDSETSKGILRATGGGNTPPYIIINTGKGAPATDSDKIWTVHYNESDDTYRFEAKDQNRFLYHQEDGEFYSLPAEETEARSKWKVESTSASLSVNDQVVALSSVKVYPNPANSNFTIELNNINATSVKIYNVLGKVVYKNATKSKNILVNKENIFKPGVYLIKVLDDQQKVYHSKLIIK
ncbi:T9SS type A sorting domain-containing protein [Polaribacter sp. L3A8]|uniref:T9SS type A sorting domain-containing protein n=1 Tax=Polaribacter sp. L3A8 TaxID=2686361 RepID=UPI00131C061B|nr:BNR-4 repeat-containing protein [Polaribacter sp. L3A8]